MRLFDQTYTLKKGFQHGTHRMRSPAQTVEAYWPKAREMGITRLANVTGLDHIGMPVWIAVRPNSSGLSTSQGKGLTADAAKASALMESIECYHAENITLPCRMDSYARLSGEAEVADISKLNYYTASPPRPDLLIPWVQGYDMMSQRQAWVPFECVSTNYVARSGEGSQNCFVQSSNGLAGGNHILESVTHALLEVVERDAVASTEDDVRQLTAARVIDPDTVNDPGCRAALDMLAGCGISAVLMTLENDLGLPVFACSIVEQEQYMGWRALPVFNGYGCHLAPGIALFRAISEAVQSRLTHISGTRDDIIQAEYKRGGNQDDLNSFRQRIASVTPQVDFSVIPSLATDAFETDIDVILSHLQRVGVQQAIAVNLTLPQFDIPVTKVVVPGLAAPVGMMKARDVYQPQRTHAVSKQGEAA